MKKMILIAMLCGIVGLVGFGCNHQAENGANQTLAAPPKVDKAQEAASIAQIKTFKNAPRGMQQELIGEWKLREKARADWEKAHPGQTQ